ncbi:hypothetical protein PHRODO_165 [Bacillus phage Phrodo]|nr:hypothetical protein BI003_gp165 [Bacillus phage Phrodo]AMW62206.1 hypothetical protein PHRODO_165 [Bacillus phage Phrodo]
METLEYFLRNMQIGTKVADAYYSVTIKISTQVQNYMLSGVT